MKVLSMVRATDEEKQQTRKILDASAELIIYRDLNDEEKEIALKTADIIIGGRMTDEQIVKTTNLKMHQTFGTGVDRHNLELIKEKNILLCNNHSHSIIIAEYAFSMLNAASKELYSNDKLLREGNWDYSKFPSVTMFNKTLLFLGYGKIAQHVKKMCAPFNMKFIAVKRTLDLEDNDVEIFLTEDKLEAIRIADFILNSLPKTKNTIDFVDEEEFSVMKKSAIIINVGRGNTINEKAMYNALKENKIKGAAIDVWYNYPKGRDPFERDSEPVIPSEYPFQGLDNIIMTAHRAWSTDYPWSEFAQTLILNVNKFIRGEKPDDIVNLEEGY